MKSLVIAAALTFAACASSPQDHDARAQDQARFEFEAGTVPIADLTKRCGEFLGWNIMVNPQELQMATQPATVTLERAVRTDRAGCEDLLSSLLWSKGFGITPLDTGRGVYEVVSLAGSRARDYVSRAAHRTVDEVRARPDSYFCVTVVAPLQHVNSVIATNALRPFFASTGGPGGSITLGNVGSGNSLVVSGPQHTVVAVLDMLRTVDVPSEAPVAPGAAQRLESLTRAVEQLTKRVEALEKRE